MLFELWLDKATLTYSEFSFLNFTSPNPTQRFADTLLFFNQAPKEDFFEGRLDLALSLRAKLGSSVEASFDYAQQNVFVSGKVLQIKCRGGKVTQTQLMAEWIDLLGSEKFESTDLLRYPIEGKYKLHMGGVDVDKIVSLLKDRLDLSDFNPTFLRSEIARILTDKRFWAKPKLTILGSLPTTCYLPSASQLTN